MDSLVSRNMRKYGIQYKKVKSILDNWLDARTGGEIIKNSMMTG